MGYPKADLTQTKEGEASCRNCGNYIVSREIQDGVAKFVSCKGRGFIDFYEDIYIYSKLNVLKARFKSCQDKKVMDDYQTKE